MFAEGATLPRYDAILIPGGGVREGGTLPLWVRARLDRALELFSGEFLVPLSAGTPHRPPPCPPSGYPIFESRAAARYLLERGAPPGCVLVELHSYDTIGNAYFSRTIHADPAGWRRLLVITSEFHLARVEAVFEWVFGLDAAQGSFELHFVPAPNTGLEGEALEQRVMKERKALEALFLLVARIQSLTALHQWLFTRHGAYSAEGYEATYRPLAEPAAESY